MLPQLLAGSLVYLSAFDCFLDCDSRKLRSTLAIAKSASSSFLRFRDDDDQDFNALMTSKAMSFNAGIASAKLVNSLMIVHTTSRLHSRY